MTVVDKSEIAEKAAREISKTLRSRVNTRWPVSHQQGWYEAANDVDTFSAAIVERAIAESQAPQPPRDFTLHEINRLSLQTGAASPYWNALEKQLARELLKFMPKRSENV